jgi:biopolymer transport protein ExbD
MTPMIDVVFLLIIFFLLSSHFARQESQLELDLPDAASREERAEDDVPRVVVNVLPEGNIQVAGDVRRAAELTEVLRVERQKTAGRLEVRIRSDRRVPYGVIEPILLACQRAGVWDVTFAVEAAR